MSNVKIQGNASGTGSLTIAAPNTNTDRTLTLPDESGTLLSSASPVIAQNGVPAFNAYGNTTVLTNSGTWTKITYNSVEVYDTHGYYDLANSRFQPLTAGYYQINASVTTSLSATGIVALMFKKNDVYYYYPVGIPNSSQGPTLSGSCIVYMNGSTDYFEIYAIQTSGSQMYIGSGNSYYSFQGILIAKA